MLVANYPHGRSKPPSRFKAYLELPSLPVERSPAVAERDRLQSGEPVAAVGAAEKNRQAVADELTAAVGEDGRATDRARQVLLVVARRGTSAPAAVWPDATADLGTHCAEQVALRLRLQKLGPREEGRGSV